MKFSHNISYMKFVSIPYNDFIYEIFIYEMLCEIFVRTEYTDKIPNSPSFPPGCPGGVPPGQAVDMCISLNLHWLSFSFHSIHKILNFFGKTFQD